MSLRILNRPARPTRPNNPKSEIGTFHSPPKKYRFFAYNSM
jgi:hypothetical protein